MCVVVSQLPKRRLTALLGGSVSVLYHGSGLCAEAFAEVRPSFVAGVRMSHRIDRQ